MLITSCSKESSINVPISLTDKSGNVFIPIDTVSKSFEAYSVVKITKGHLKGIFNDTIRSGFYLAYASTPHWDTIYHPADTTIFSTHYTGHTLIVQTDVDLTNFSPPYHFILLGLRTNELKVCQSGLPTVLLTVSSDN